MEWQDEVNIGGMIRVVAEIFPEMKSASEFPLEESRSGDEDGNSDDTENISCRWDNHLGNDMCDR